jgi:hypothetical protein
MEAKKLYGVFVGLKEECGSQLFDLSQKLITAISPVCGQKNESNVIIYSRLPVFEAMTNPSDEQIISPPERVD